MAENKASACSGFSDKIIPVRSHATSAQLALLVIGVCGAAETPQSLLTARCQVCHNDQVHSGGLSLTTLAGMLKGGSRGPAIIPGKPEASMLYRLISGGQPAMPKKGEENIRQWIQGGVTYGASDEWSYKVVDKPTYCYDMHATMLDLLGIDHQRLTYRHNGIDRRITDVYGEVIREVLA
jgi:hypothetical protein